MTINGNFFWFLMGILFILVASGFRVFANERNWTITWWKGLLLIAWYAIFSVNLYAGGILIGEHETGAGLKLILAGLLFSFFTGVPLWRLLSRKSRKTEIGNVQPETSMKI